VGDVARARGLWRENVHIVLERRSSKDRGVDRECYNLACLAALVGEQARAMELLRRAVDAGFANEIIVTDHDLDTLRGDAGFEDMLAEVREPLAG